ncbi:MAG: alcohol dehydrogenase [Bacteroidetes bacterium]|nr:MAG: alcohol dehydrogenase [Bacteroidota bacterium]PTM13303.1 MAG: alcohol dehydrogenase [Bacteroidota bacterium]
MQAILYHRFQAPLTLERVPDPSPTPQGVVVEVKATGLCRSDWHGWMGHDADITLPHVPGHELAGVVVAVGSGVQQWKMGDRVTVPFVGGCGHCAECRAGDQQVCPNQFQPGFTHWGSFADYVAIDYADTNLVRLPAAIDDVTAASLGCRFATSFRAVVDQGRVRGGEWVAVHGCGGVGLSAIMIAKACGAQVIAIDIKAEALALARQVGADFVVNAAATPVVEAIRELTQGGVHLSLDALGHPTTLFHSITCLRRRGRHVQVGLLAPEQIPAPFPVDRVIAYELEILGSHGMQAHRYPAMLEMILQGRLQPQLLVSRTIDLAAILTELPRMDEFGQAGMLVVKTP